MTRRPPRPTRSDTLIPSATLFRSALSFYRSRLPSKMTFNMATGYYTFAPADFSVNPAGAKTDLTIKHTDGGLSQVDVDLQSGGSITQLPISGRLRSEEHTSELQSLMRISYAVFCLKKKKTKTKTSRLNVRTNEYNM